MCSVDYGKLAKALLKSQPEALIELPGAVFVDLCLHLNDDAYDEQNLSVHYITTNSIAEGDQRGLILPNEVCWSSEVASVRRPKWTRVPLNTSTGNKLKCKDLQFGADVGSSLFLTLPLMPSTGDVSGAITFGFAHADDVTAETVKRASRLAKYVLFEENDEVARIQMLLSSVLFPLRAAQYSDDEEADSQRDGQVDLELLRDALSGPTLKFNNEDQELAFTLWQAKNLMKLDMAGYLLCTMFAMVETFLPREPLYLYSKVTKWHLLRSTLGYMPIFLFFSKRTRDLYINHRELVLLFTWIMCSHWIMSARHYIDWIGIDVFVSGYRFFGYTYIMVLGIMFPLRVAYFAPLIVSVAALDLGLLPMFCEETKHTGTHASVHSCFWNLTWKVTAICVIVPLFIAYQVEKKARRVFLASQ